MVQLLFQYFTLVKTMCIKSTYCMSFESQDVIILYKEKSRKPILQVHEMLEMNESHIKSVGEV